jgi:hypothetical protein
MMKRYAKKRSYPKKKNPNIQKAADSHLLLFFG